MARKESRRELEYLLDRKSGQPYNEWSHANPRRRRMGTCLLSRLPQRPRRVPLRLVAGGKLG